MLKIKLLKNYQCHVRINYQFKTKGLVSMNLVWLLGRKNLSAKS